MRSGAKRAAIEHWRAIHSGKKSCGHSQRRKQARFTVVMEGECRAISAFGKRRQELRRNHRNHSETVRAVRAVRVIPIRTRTVNVMQSLICSHKGIGDGMADTLP